MIRESVSMAFDSFKSNRLRSLLSLLGVVIGVASVVAVTTLASSGTASIKKQYAQFSPNAIRVYSGWNDATGQPAIEFTESMLDDMGQSLRNLKRVLPKSNLDASLSHGRQNATVQLAAVASGYTEIMGASIDQGRELQPQDEYRQKPVIILGASLAASLFPEGDPVGKSVSMLVGKFRQPMQVIAVLKPKEAFLDDDWNRSAYISYAFAKRKISRGSRIDTLVALAPSATRSLALGSELERYFLEKTGNGRAVTVASPKKWIESDMKTTGTISLLLTGIAAISLLVGGIGIMNIMLVSVTERTREIGIRKALGATPRHIRSQFLVESASLSITGGLLGLVFGNLVAFFAVKGFRWDFSASPSTALLAFGVSAATGIFFGLYPAVRAAALDPAKALAAD